MPADGKYIKYIAESVCAAVVQVVEGMGSVVQMHADGRRGLDVEKYSAEAFIDMNGPTLPRADGIIAAALDRHFGSKPWHFSHTSHAGLHGTFTLTSKVLQRLKGEPSKLPFLE